MSTWCCTRCTYSNHASSTICELCDFSVEQQLTTSISRILHNVDDGAHITCELCSFINDLSAESCEMCLKVFSEVHLPSQRDSRVMTCSRCHISFPTPINERKPGGQSDDCPICGDGLRQNPGLEKKHSWSDDKDFQGELITSGIIELVSEDLEKIDCSVNSCPPSKKITTEYAICSPCPHISQNGAEGHDWSCGYRNIQMISYSLLSQSNSCNDFKGLLFNGQGDDVVNRTDLMYYLNLFYCTEQDKYSKKNEIKSFM